MTESLYVNNININSNNNNNNNTDDDDKDNKLSYGVRKICRTDVHYCFLYYH